MIMAIQYSSMNVSRCSVPIQPLNLEVDDQRQDFQVGKCFEVSPVDHHVINFMVTNSEPNLQKSWGCFMRRVYNASSST